jgi:hypothetical protein
MLAGMPRNREHEPLLDRVIILFLLALFLLLSPFTEWWAADDSPWYTPYLIWGILILLSWRLRRHLERHEL